MRSWRFWRNFSLVLVATVSAVFLGGAVWVSGQNIDKLAEPLPEPTIIYDRYGQPASKLRSSKVVPVKLADVAEPMKQAIVAVEDKRFYNHRGVDVGALARAMWRNATAGGVVEGGSTITQQLAKNGLLSPERSLKRKLREAAVAIKIESEYEKDEILEMYLNRIYFGEGSWGIQAAASTYFGKKASQLTVAESALLAALPKAPSRYTPFRNPEGAAERRNVVLELMKEQGYLTDEAYAKAVLEPIRLNRVKGNDPLVGQYGSYIDYVIEEAVNVYGIPETELMGGGLRIYTGLDPKAQQAAEAVFADATKFPPTGKDGVPVQSGAVLTDPSNGAIRGMVGGRGDQDSRGLNRAVSIRRQPGSAFKPIAVYGPALDSGYAADSTLYDGELDIGGYRPTNAGGTSRGQVTLREALIRSYNVPAVWLLNEIGVSKGWKMAERSGFEVTEDDMNLSLALGGLHKGVSPLQMAQAYGAFANGGVMRQAHAITVIKSKDGNVLAKAEPVETKLVSPQTAYSLTLLLEEVIERGTGKRAALGRPVAGKTGTTQLPDTKQYAGKEGTLDAWFVGYTPQLAAAVWVGYDKPDAEHVMAASGGSSPAAVFQAIMSRALEGVPAAAFEAPPGWKGPAAVAPAPRVKKDSVWRADRGEWRERDSGDVDDDDDDDDERKEDRKKRGKEGKGKKERDEEEDDD